LRPTLIRDNMMKKFASALIAILCFAFASLNAQEYTNHFEGSYIGSIPGLFTTSGHSNLVVVMGTGKLCLLDSDLTVITNVYNENNILEAYYMDADATSITVSGFHNTSDHGLLLTQTLFNSDGTIEFMELQDYESNHYRTFNIKNTNGTILHSIQADEGYFFADYRCAFVVKIENHFYLVLREMKTGSETVKHVFYLIRKDQGLTEVDVDLPISVFPTAPTRDQQITVELGEDIDAIEITIVNSLGQVIKRIPLENGQREITIPASELGTGLNLINTHTQQGQGSCKIIVR